MFTEKNQDTFADPFREVRRFCALLKMDAVGASNESFFNTLSACELGTFPDPAVWLGVSGRFFDVLCVLSASGRTGDPTSAAVHMGRECKPHRNCRTREPLVSGSNVLAFTWSSSHALR